MQLPSLNKYKTQIIDHLLKFRYINIYQFQQLYNHKDSRRIREWLAYLEEKKYIYIIKDEKDKTKPYIICLAQRAGHILKKDEDVDTNFLKWLYKENKKSEEFMIRNLFLVDAFLFFERNKEKNSKLNFFTEQDLTGYTYFPKPIPQFPSAYIDVQEENGNSRYFLDSFDETIPSGVLRYRIHYYLEYAQNGEWQANTDNAPFPTILLVLPTERKKLFVKHFAKAVLEKSFIDDVEIFVTTKDTIRFAKDATKVWKNVMSE